MEIREDGTVVESLGGGEPFAFRATLKRVADFQAATGVIGIAELWNLIERSDAQALYLGLKHLCTSKHAAQLDDIAIGAFLPTAAEILVTAMTFGVEAPAERDVSRSAPREERPTRRSRKAAAGG